MQFGHAGACARGQGESAREKNAAMAEAGAIVPNSFAEFGAKGRVVDFHLYSFFPIVLF